MPPKEICLAFNMMMSPESETYEHLPYVTKTKTITQAVDCKFFFLRQPTKRIVSLTWLKGMLLFQTLIFKANYEVLSEIHPCSFTWASSAQHADIRKSDLDITRVLLVVMVKGATRVFSDG